MQHYTMYIYYSGCNSLNIQGGPVSISLNMQGEPVSIRPGGGWHRIKILCFKNFEEKSRDYKKYDWTWLFQQCLYIRCIILLLFLPFYV